MAGYEGKLLKVNLTTGAIKTSTVDKETLRKFIGGSLSDLSSTPIAAEVFEIVLVEVHPVELETESARKSLTRAVGHAQHLGLHQLHG